MNHWLLTLDASTPTTVVALGRSDATAPLASVVTADGANQTSEKLTEHVDHVLRACKLDMSDVTQIAAGVGPGTFTGTRVTAAFAKGISMGLGLGVHPVSTLEALAWDGIDTSTDRQDVVAMLDARRGEIYGAVYEWNQGHGAPLLQGDERCVTLERFIEDASLPTTAILVGTGVAAYKDRLDATGGFTLIPTQGLSAAGLWSASRRALSQTALDPAALEVTYLRASYAEMGIHKPKRPMTKSPFI